MDDAALIQVLKALADPTRFRIMREVAAAGELTCGQVGDLFTLAQPTVSHHIHILIEVGLLTVRRAGQMGFVSVNRATLASVPELLSDRLVAPAEASQGEIAVPGLGEAPTSDAADEEPPSA